MNMKSKLDKVKGPKERDGRRLLFGLVVNIMLFASIILLVGAERNLDEASASNLRTVELDPSEHQYLTYNSASSALAEANSQLSEMEAGDIHTLDGESEYFTAELIRDYGVGDIIYWSLCDTETLVCIDAVSGEILEYMYIHWQDGSMTKAQIEERAEDIAPQFHTLPNDRVGPESIESTTAGYSVWVDNETSESWTEGFWYVYYNRTKDSIVTEDQIRLTLNPDGSLYRYYKVWNMALASMDTTYDVTQSEAESTALETAGSGSSVVRSMKRIVRPNHMWSDYEDDPQYGLNPMCVWEVWVEDSEESLCEIHIDGVEGITVGGDYVYGYYSDP